MSVAPENRTVTSWAGVTAVKFPDAPAFVAANRSAAGLADMKLTVSVAAELLAVPDAFVATAR